MPFLSLELKAALGEPCQFCFFHLNRKGVTRMRIGVMIGADGANSTLDDVIAIAKMAEGSFAQTQATVKVTIGGCGG